jgi:hypothetical protein
MYDAVVAAILVKQSLLLIFSTITDSAAQPGNATGEMDDTDGAMSAHPASSFVRRFSEQVSVIGREPEESTKVYDPIPLLHGIFVDLISRHARERERGVSWVEGLSVNAVEPAPPEAIIGLYTTSSTCQHYTTDGGSSDGERLACQAAPVSGRGGDT